MQSVERAQIEQVEVGDEAFSTDVTPDVDVEVFGLHNTLEEMADEMEVQSFKCLKCGLVHQHTTTKHRLSDTFDVSEFESSQMDYNPVCHCGAQEAGRRAAEIGVDRGEASHVASQAPVPPETVRDMNEQYGSL